MASEITLGRIERVDLRKAFPDEAKNFTPWLAEPANLEELGKALNLRLEQVSTEESVGGFRADVVCKEATNGATVLIENQLNRTDHVHLGQILLYVAGLDAATVVWIAQTFLDEHRASLDWLNAKTDPSVRFYGVEISLWRIGSSEPAPKFDIVVQPVDVRSGELTDLERLNLDYWSLVNGKLHRVFNPKPSRYQSLNFGVLTTDFILRGSFNKNQLEVALIITGARAYDYAKLLEREIDGIEDSIGIEVAWKFRELGGLNKVFVNRPGSVHDAAAAKDRSELDSLAGWMASQLELFRKAFADRVKNLQLPDSEPDSDGS